MAVPAMKLSLFVLLLLARSPVHCSALFVFNSTVDIDGTLRSNASLSVPLEIGSGALFSERSEMYTWTGINERYANGDFVTAELTWALPNSTTPGAICDATPEDIAATKGKIVLFHTIIRNRVCDTGTVLLELEAAGAAGSINLIQFAQYSELVNYKDLTGMKMPPQALLLPASHELATVMGCPAIADLGGRQGGTDDCELSADAPRLYVTMRYAQDPWALYLNHPLLMGTYFFSSFMFLYTGTLSYLSLRYLPKFTAKWTPKHCTWLQTWLQDSRSVALHLEVPYAVVRILDMVWGQAIYRGYQGYLPGFAIMSKIFWSLPFSFGMFIINMQLLHWAQMCDAGSMKGMSDKIQRRRGQLIGFSFFQVFWSCLYNVIMTVAWGSLASFLVWCVWALLLASNVCLCGVGFLIYGSQILKALSDGMKTAGGGAAKTKNLSTQSKKARMQTKSIIKLTKYVMISAGCLCLIFLGVIWQVIAVGKPNLNYSLSRMFTALTEAYMNCLVVYNLSPVTFKKLYNKKYGKKRSVLPKSVVETANSVVESSGDSTAAGSSTAAGTSRGGTSASSAGGSTVESSVPNSSAGRSTAASTAASSSSS